MLSHTLSIVIAIVASLNVLGCGWLIWWTARSRPNEVTKGEVIDHVWDGDLQERNNPMPRWWLILFFLSIAFCFGYFLLYPALGTFGGILGWSKAGASTSRRWPPPTSNTRRSTPRLPVARSWIWPRDPKALALGRQPVRQQLRQLPWFRCPWRLGFPNLTDDDWLHGGAPENDREIDHARPRRHHAGARPGFGSAGRQRGGGLRAESERTQEPADKIEAGKARFAAVRGLSRSGRQRQSGSSAHRTSLMTSGSTAAPKMTCASRSRRDVMGKCRPTSGWAWIRSACCRPMCTASRTLREAP